MTTFDVQKGDRLVMEASDTEVGVTGHAQIHPKDASVWVPVRGQGDRYDVWFRLSGDAPAVIRSGLSVYRHSFLTHAATAEKPKPERKKARTNAEGAREPAATTQRGLGL